MGLTKIKLENFTAFHKLDLDLSPGVNVFVGENGTGKTHLLKLAYWACEISKRKKSWGDFLKKLFLPSGKSVERFVRKNKIESQCRIDFFQEKMHLGLSFSTQLKQDSKIKGHKQWFKSPVECVYIPVKEMLSNAPGFRSLYSQRDIHFEEIYADILDRAFLPPLRGPFPKEIQSMLTRLEEMIGGKVIIKGEEFFLKDKEKEIEFSLLAEGPKKPGLLWLLIRNGSIKKGSLLFWDEPESSLNPSLYGPLMEILLDLQRMGVQIFLATHDYVILKELDLRLKAPDKILFHSLYRDKKTGGVLCNTTDDYLQIDPNAIQETYLDIFDREIECDLENE